MLAAKNNMTFDNQDLEEDEFFQNMNSILTNHNNLTVYHRASVNYQNTFGNLRNTTNPSNGNQTVEEEKEDDEESIYDRTRSRTYVRLLNNHPSIPESL